MKELLEVLAGWLLFMLDGDRYRIVNSQGSARGDALIELESDRLKWRLVRDRTQVFLDCCVPEERRREVWNSLDILVALVEERVTDGLLSEEKARWLESNIDRVEELFSPDLLDSTMAQIKVLQRQRAKRLFG